MLKLAATALAFVYAVQAAPAPQLHGLQPPANDPEPPNYNPEMLSLHNNLRATHDAVALTWNATLAFYAQQWANNCQFEHGDLQGGGQNLAAGFNSDGTFQSAADAFQGWANEESQYNPAAPVGSHFTQIVWKGTTSVGCARQHCVLPGLSKTGLSSFDVCDYFPAGNFVVNGDVVGSYDSNVTP